MVRSTEQVNPRIFSWARESAGLSLEEAADKLGLKSTEKETAASKLARLERGERPISRSTLDKAAIAFRRPLITFYLQDPPKKAQEIADFRTISGPRPREDAILSALIRDVMGRQQLLRDALLDDEDFLPITFIGSCVPSDGAQKVADKIREALGITPDSQKRAKDASTLFADLRKATERAGIYVLLLGDLGSYHSDLGENIFRGMAFADKTAPFIVINDNDAPTARAFSLLHELAHMWINESGVSGTPELLSQSAIEMFCNQVASLFLLPREAIQNVTVDRTQSTQEVLALIKKIAEDWNISQAAVAYRLMFGGLISKAMASDVFKTLSGRRGEATKLLKKKDGGPDYYVLCRSRLGTGLIGAVKRAMQQDSLTHTKAARILGVKANSVDKLLAGLS